MKDKTIQDAMGSIENRVRHVYNQGYSDGIADGNINSGLFADKVREAYNNGLEDAWECMEKICAEVIDGGLDSNTLKQIFGTASIVNIFKTNSASEAMTKLKEYEEQQKQSEKSCKNCKHGINGMLNFKSGRCEACYYDERIGGNCLFEQKQTEEKTDKSCESCRFADLQEYEFPCSACSASHTYRWEARKGAEE